VFVPSATNKDGFELRLTEDQPSQSMDRAQAAPRMDSQRYGAARSFFSLLQLQFPADAQILRFWQDPNI